MSETSIPASPDIPGGAAPAAPAAAPQPTVALTLDQILALYPDLQLKTTATTAGPPAPPAPAVAALAPATDSAADANPSVKPTPAVGSMVSFTYTANSGLPHVKRGLVVDVVTDTDPDVADRVLVNWLPDGEALLPVADLD